MVDLNDLEVALILLGLYVLATFFLAHQIYTYLMFRKRELLYPIFKARDHLIRCVANGSIRREDAIFEIFYNSANDIVRMAHTETFSLGRFVQRVATINKNPETVEEVKSLAAAIQRSPTDFQTAILEFIQAVQHILVRKNLLLNLLVRFQHSKDSIESMRLVIARFLQNNGAVFAKFLINKANKNLKHYESLTQQYDQLENFKDTIHAT